jgi:hypothetical protein
MRVGDARLDDPINQSRGRAVGHEGQNFHAAAKLLDQLGFAFRS